MSINYLPPLNMGKNLATINQCIISYDTVMKVYHIYKNVKYVPVYVRLINFPHALFSSSCIRSTKIYSKRMNTDCVLLVFIL